MCDLPMRVIDAISKSGKIFVGHNSLLDLLHTVDKFSKPLPPTSQEFKEELTKMFPM